MPEGTLNRTFRLSKIPFSHFFAFLSFFGKKMSQNAILSNCFWKNVRKHNFIGFFEKKNIPKRDFIDIFLKITPKTRFCKQSSRGGFLYIVENAYKIEAPI